MSRSTKTGTAANAKSTRRRYRVVIEMVQVFAEEVEIEAETAGLAQVAAQKLIAKGALGRLEFQDLASTRYRVASVRVLQ